MHQCIRFAMNPSDSGTEPGLRESGGGSAQKGTVHDKQRRPNGERRLSRLRAKADGIAIQSVRTGVKRRGYFGPRCNVDDCVLSSERGAAVSGREPLATIFALKLLPGACRLRRGAMVTGDSVSDAPHHPAIVGVVAAIGSSFTNAASRAKSRAGTARISALPYTISISAIATYAAPQLLQCIPGTCGHSLSLSNASSAADGQNAARGGDCERLRARARQRHRPGYTRAGIPPRNGGRRTRAWSPRVRVAQSPQKTLTQKTFLGTQNRLKRPRTPSDHRLRGERGAPRFRLLELRAAMSLTPRRNEHAPWWESAGDPLSRSVAPTQLERGWRPLRNRSGYADRLAVLAEPLPRWGWLFRVE